MADGSRNIVLYAVQRLLRPLVRALIHFEITYPVLIRMLKSLYVEVADQDFSLEDKQTTDSRISILTGVHRKDVRQFREKPETLKVPQAVSLSSLAVSLWLGDPVFHDAHGAPRALRRSSKEAEPSFEDLVQSISKDVRPRALLDELLRTGIVTEDEQGFLILSAQAFVPSDDLEQTAYFFGRNLRDHIASASANLSGHQPPFLERAVFYDRLSEASVDELRATADDLGNHALLALNAKAVALAKNDEGRSEATRRMTFGVYFHEGPDE